MTSCKRKMTVFRVMLSWSFRFCQFLLPVLLLYWMFRTKVDSKLLAEALATITPVAVLLLLSNNIAQRLISAWFSHRLFSALHLSASFRDVLSAQWVASFLATLLPGDLLSGGVTVAILGKRHGGTGSWTAGLVFSKIWSYLLMLPAAALSLAWSDGIAQDVISVLLGFFLIVLLLAIVPFYSSAARKILAYVSVAFLRHVKWKPLSRFHHEFWTSVHACSELPKHKHVEIFLFCLLLQVLRLAEIIFAFMALKIEIPLSEVLWVQPLVSLIAAFPLALGGTGLRELTFITLLEQLHRIPAESSALFTLIVYFSWLLTGAMGIMACSGVYKGVIKTQASSKEEEQ